MIIRELDKRALALLISVLLVLSVMISTIQLYKYTFAQSKSSSNISISRSNEPSTAVGSDLEKEMQRLVDSGDPTDIATLAYIYGFPLVAVIRTANFTTNPNIPHANGHGPLNTINHFREFPNASFTDIVRLNVDTLYSIAYLDLSREPLVLKIPSITDRYYSLQFINAYTNNFLYIGSRLNETAGGTFLITGPDWKGTIPLGVKQIEFPTNSGVIAIRILVNGPDDVRKVNSIQDEFSLSPLSVSEGKGISTSPGTIVGAVTKASKQIPVAPDPALIPKTGIMIYDEIGGDLANNPPDSNVITKFRLIGVGPGLRPSHTANDNVKQALENGIVNGEQLINQKSQSLGTFVNGWAIPGLTIKEGKAKSESGNHKTDYLLRASVAKIGLFGNSAEEAVYPIAFKDSQGQNLTGMHNYVIHFDKGQLPPVKAFWSLTVYNNKSYLVDNPINRYSIRDRTPGLKYNNDGSLDLYIQNVIPKKDEVSNWLPSPPFGLAASSFMTLRILLV